MKKDATWLWHSIWIFALILSVGIVSMYIWLPVDGANGDMTSFTAQGFRVHWIIEPRPEGLKANDVIIRAGGYSFEEWLNGARQDPQWRTNTTIQYEILRDGEVIALDVQLAPLTFMAIIRHWGLQFLAAISYFIFGLIVFWKQPQQHGARLFMVFCTTLAMQYVGDAYNFQFATIPWRWPFWVQFSFEFIIYTISVASVCYFTLVFPTKHPLIQHYPRLLPAILYLIPLLLIGRAFLPIPDWRSALLSTNNISWGIAIIQIILAISLGMRSAIKADNPVARAQIRWILFGATVGVALVIPGYVLPLILGRAPFFHHPIMMIAIGYMIIFLGISILRYRLFDIEIVINRTLVYTLLSAILASLYFIVVSISTFLLNAVLQRENETLVAFIATLSIAAVFVPLRQRSQHFIDRIFYRSKIDYQTIANELSERLATSILPSQLADILTKELPSLLQIKWASLAILDMKGIYINTIGGGARSALPANHPFPRYLLSTKKPILRLLPPKDIPEEAIQYLDSNSIELSVPLEISNVLVGIIDLGEKSSGEIYNRDELNLFHLIGRQAAVAVENSRLLQVKEYQARELSSLHEAAVAISSSLEIDQVLQNLVEQIGQVLDISCAYICDLDGVSYTTRALAQWISPEAIDQNSILSSPCYLSEIPKIYQALSEYRISTYPAHEFVEEIIDALANLHQGIRAFLVVPLVNQRQLIGSVELWETRQEREFNESDIRLCQTIAADAAAAMERARLFQAERKQRRLAEALQEAATIVGSTLNFEVVLDQIFEQVEKVIRGDTYNIMLIEGKIAKVIRGHGYGDDLDVRKIMQYVLDIDEFETLNTMATTGNALVITDTAADPLWTHREDWQKPKSYVGAPIRYGGKTVGYLNVNGNQINQFSEDDAKFLKAFAQHAATAMEKARLFEAERKQRLLAEALQEAATIVGSTLDIDVVMDRIFEQVEKVIQGDTYNIMLIEGGIAQVIRGHGYGDDPNVRTIMEYELDLNEFKTLNYMFTTGNALMISDTSSHPLWTYQEDWQKPNSYVGAPIVLGGKTAGFLNINSNQTHQFIEDDARWLEAFAQHAATAINNANLFQRIKDSLGEKEILLKEIHHRVKNNLQIINSLLSLQSAQIEDSRVGSVFHDSQNRVRSMALIHDMLYHSDSLSYIKFAEYIQDLVDYMCQVYQVDTAIIRMEIEAQEISLDIDTAVPCGMILTELISNALKHAFPDQRSGKIRIELKPDRDNQVTLIVADDGVGMPEGIDLNNSSTLGLQLVGTLTNQLDGKIELNSCAGTTYTLKFSISQ